MINVIVSCSGGGQTPAPSAVMTSSVASTAASSASNGAPVTITFGIYDDPSRDVVAKAQAALFTQDHPNITVQVVNVPYANYYTKLGAQISSGESWDVFMINGGYFAQAAPQGVLLDLTSPLQQAGLNMQDYVVDPYDSQYNNKTYALPYELNQTGIFYNKAMFDAAHVVYPTDGWTWNDLLSDAQALTKSQNGKTTQWGFYSQNLYPSLVSFIAEAGGAVLDSTRTKSALNTPAVKSAIQFMVDLVRKYHVSPGASDMPANVDPFLTGAVAMVPSYSFSVQPDLKAPFSWGVAPWPKGVQGGAAYWTQGIAVFSGSKQQAAAVQFAEFLMSPAAQQLQAKERGATPSLKSVALGTEYTASPPDGMSVFMQEYQQSGVPVPFNAQWAQIMGTATAAMESEFAKAYLGEESVDQAVVNADSAVSQILATK
jgi:multiple sugar transport system substrate-binding protein